MQAMNISSMVADAWRNTGPDERAVYVDMAEKDKARYEVEKSLYKGNWTVPKWQKDSHHTTAPRRPKSAFFAFSNKRRADVRKSMPTKATNGEVSRELSRLWREAPQHVKKPYIDEEKQLREQYLIDIAKWREVEAERMKERQESALKLAEKVNLIGGSRSNRVDPERSLVEIAKGAEASGRVMAPVTYGEKKRRGEFSFHELAQLPRQEQHADQKHPGLGSTEELLQQSKDLSIFPKSAPYAARPTSAGGSIAKKDSDESEKPELFSASELAWLDSDTIDNSSPTREISKNRRESQIFDSLSKVPGTVMEPSAARALLTLSESDSSPDSNQASPTVARDVSQGGKALKGESRSLRITPFHTSYTSHPVPLWFLPI